MSGARHVLSPEAIAALVDAARDGRLPEEPPPPRRRRRMRAVDFTLPTKFNSEQERRIKRGLEAFCRTASTRLSAELRVPLELEVIASTQLTWSSAHAQVPANSITALVEASPLGTRLMLSCEPGLLVARSSCCSAARTSRTSVNDGRPTSTSRWRDTSAIAWSGSSR